MNWRVLPVALIGWLPIAGAVGCENEPSAQRAAESAPKTAVASLTCDVSVWLDLTAARRDSKFDRLRGLVLAKASEGSHATSALAGDLEQKATSALLCVCSTSQPAGKVVRLNGPFPPNTEAQIAASAPSATKTNVKGLPVIRNGATWIAPRADHLLIADSESILSRAVEHGPADGDLDKSKLLFARIAPHAKFGGVDRLLPAFGADPKEWQAITLSVSRESDISELAFIAQSPRAASALLENSRKNIEEARQVLGPTKAQAIERLSAEAMDNRVALRFAGSLDEFLALVTALSSKPPRHGHDHGDD